MMPDKGKGTSKPKGTGKGSAGEAKGSDTTTPKSGGKKK
jgi:hypothetical protein